MRKSIVPLLLVGLLCGAVAVAAQPAPPGAPPEGFVPANSVPQAEQLPAAPLLVGAYAFVWVALLVYVWSLWRRLARVERELADLARRVRKA